jgi:hypothetical protein
MTYENFKQIIDLQVAHHKRIHDLCLLKVDLIETFFEQQKVVELLWESVLTADGYDWLCWYLYEKDGIKGKPRQNLSAWDENKNEICKDLKGLYDYLIRENYFKTQQQ